MSGLKVNYHKSCLVGINICQCWLQEAANILNCKIGSTPFNYLGLPIGVNHRSKLSWQPVIETVRSRLSNWKHEHLSFGGRVVILKSVLTAIPVYFLSFFKAPADQALDVWMSEVVFGYIEERSKFPGSSSKAIGFNHDPILMQRIINLLDITLIPNQRDTSTPVRGGAAACVGDAEWRRDRCCLD
ncbi:uncharacterized protein LOC131597339 [Vicia villosa]|uniref:uncharacterized protein LOC131597339 n=1 Tax=Vicia villosa TaxID=3911 RepID=UPI00273AE461|nr:uncharacterized protein LOC131597339 [Vicia villosa]